MKKIVALLILVLSLAVVPMIGQADHPDESTAGAEGIYLKVTDAPSASVWQESNNHPGLQTTDDTVNNVPKDTQLA